MRLDRSWKYKWHKWYAWYPVWCDDNNSWAWLEIIERRRNFWPVNDYRLFELNR